MADAVKQAEIAPDAGMSFGMPDDAFQLPPIDQNPFETDNFASQFGQCVAPDLLPPSSSFGRPSQISLFKRFEFKITGLVYGSSNVRNMEIAEDEGLRHITQTDKVDCLHTSIKECRAYLRNAGLSINGFERLTRAQANHIIPSTIYNSQIGPKTCEGRVPTEYGRLIQTREGVERTIKAIDDLLDMRCPVITYVKHLGGLHVVVIKGREVMPDGKVKYTFDEPGSSTFTEGTLIYDPANGTCIKKGLRTSHGPVAAREYVLAGIYDYRGRLMETVSGGADRAP